MKPISHFSHILTLWTFNFITFKVNLDILLVTLLIAVTTSLTKAV